MGPLLDVLLPKHATRRQVNNAPSAADFFVSRLPGLPAALRLKLYAGHLSAVPSTSSSGSDAHLFFLLAKARHIADRQRLVIWLNGGPGCSSFDGALMEIGPVRLDKTRPGQLVEAPSPWTEYANVLFVDQPAGTGYSYINTGSPVGELGPAADQFVTFLANFYALFPELQAVDTYIAGESYAGQYIPYIANAMLQTKLVNAPLRGLIMGNAWIDPEIQYPAYLDFSYQEKLIAPGSADAMRAENVMRACNATLSTSGRGKVLVPECEGLLWAALPSPDAANQCVNVYNVAVREPCGSEFPPDVIRAQPYLRKPDVIDAFHATHKPTAWEQCNNTVSDQMWSPASRPAIELLPGILEQGVSVLLFAGELDMMCNWLGIERSIERMTWRGGTGLNATAQDWHVAGKRVGSWTSSRNLHWVRIANASHMVPIEAPAAAHDIFLRLANVTLLDAAGSAARLPSSLGGSTVQVVGLTSPDGRPLLSGGASSGNNTLAGLSGGTAAATDDLTEAEVAVVEQSREAYYGPRRSAVLVLVLVASLAAIALLLRWQTRKKWSRRRPRAVEPDGMERAELLCSDRTRPRGAV